MESSGLRKRVADMMDGGKYRPKGYGMAAAGQRLPCALLLLLVLAAGALSVVVMHKVREQRAFAVVLKERDVQAVSLRILLQVWPWLISSVFFFFFPLFRSCMQKKCKINHSASYRNESASFKTVKLHQL